jgi:hypothetical protein
MGHDKCVQTSVQKTSREDTTLNNNIKICLREKNYENVNCSQMVQVDCFEHIDDPFVFYKNRNLLIRHSCQLTAHEN